MKRITFTGEVALPDELWEQLVEQRHGSEQNALDEVQRMVEDSLRNYDTYLGDVTINTPSLVEESK